MPEQPNTANDPNDPNGTNGTSGVNAAAPDVAADVAAGAGSGGDSGAAPGAGPAGAAEGAPADTAPAERLSAPPAPSAAGEADEAFDIPESAPHRKLQVVVICIAGLCVLLAAVSMVVLGLSLTSDNDDQEQDSDMVTCVSDAFTAQVGADGSLQVSDTRTSDPGNYYVSVYPLEYPEGASLDSLAVTVRHADGTQEALPQRAFQSSWRVLALADDEGAEGQRFFAYDDQKHKVYVFDAYGGGNLAVTLRYTYDHAVSVQGSAATLSWDYVPLAWGATSRGITADVTLPVPEGQAFNADTVLAYGWGVQANGADLNASTGTVSYRVDTVPRGQETGINLVFPASWVPQAQGIGGSAASTGSAADAGTAVWAQAQKDKQAWDSASFAQNAWNSVGWVIGLLLSVIAIACTAVFYVRFGKEHEPLFKEKYWRDVPDRTLHPLVTKNICRWNTGRDDDLAGELFHLVSEGYLAMRWAPRQWLSGPGPVPPAGAAAGEASAAASAASPVAPAPAASPIAPAPAAREDAAGRATTAESFTCYFSLTDKDRSDLTEIDQKALDIVFTLVAGGYGNAREVSFEQIAQFSKVRQQSYYDAIKSWLRLIGQTVDKGNQMFEEPGETLMIAWLIIPGCLGMSLGCFGGMAGNLAPLLAWLPGGIVMLASAHAMRRRTRRAVEVAARSHGLKNWMEDYTTLKDATPAAVKVWGPLYVYAYLLGVAPRVADKIGSHSSSNTSTQKDASADGNQPAS